MRNWRSIVYSTSSFRETLTLIVFCNSASDCDIKERVQSLFSYDKAPEK